jgi:hypothetical protein
MNILLMKKNSIIKTPVVYITPDLKEGEDISIHVINSKQTFLNLKFEEGDFDVLYKPILSTDNVIDLEKNPGLKKHIAIIEDKIVALGNLYTAYNYLLSLKNGEFYLLSVSLQGLALGFDITKEVADKIDLLVDKPIWDGVFTRRAVSAFIEDIFVQRK